jgi:aminoglycoside 3-N-acetyltransferase
VTESNAIAAADQPRTRRGLVSDLRRMGVRAGEVLLVHSSLSALGWTVGGQVTVVHALLDVLGPAGTLVVPSHSGDNSDPRHWRNPPVPEAWWPAIRAEMPAYDPVTTPARSMGRIADAVRCWPGAVRSPHPQHSMAALGPAAQGLMAEHPLDCQFGDRSPLGRLEEAGARVLLLGVDFSSCTCLHLAEARVPGAPTEPCSCAATIDGERRWVTYTDVVARADDFADLGADFEATGGVTCGRVGSARCRLFDLAEIVRYGLAWLPAQRGGPWRAARM